MANEKLVAYNEFQQARRQAWRQQLSSRWGGRDTQLIPFDTIRTQLKQRNPFYRGIQEVPISQIVGSVGRYHAFDRSFLPLNDDLKERWVNLHALAQTQGWTPIEIYKVGNAYFVKDGNHRVSVAQAIGNSAIEAHIWEYPEDLLINPDDSLDQMLIRLGEKHFISVTHLDKLYPDHNIRFTTPGRYTELLAQIEDLQAQLSFIDHTEMPYEEAVGAWYEMIYLPVIQIIQEAKLLENFPDNSEADLFVWLSVYRDNLEEQLGEYETLADLAHKVAERYKMGRLGKITRQLLRWFGQKAPSP